MTENVLLTNKHILIVEDNLVVSSALQNEFNYIKKNFCGTVTSDRAYTILSDTVVYLCGNIEKIYHLIHRNHLVYVIRDLSTDYDIYSTDYEVIDIGRVPINYHNVGVYFRDYFDPELNYFDLISTEHKFQTLTESNKASNAFRNGIYLTRVKKSNDGTEFNLLRCSTNLNGPTDNFRTTDDLIINDLNKTSKHFFRDPVEFNHVLAQTYLNKTEQSTDIIGKILQKKAKIAQHSDKTKDMPVGALMAFCTFYENYHGSEFTDSKTKQIKKNNFDYCYNGISALTKLRFRLKKEVIDQSFVNEFDVVLYPNSVFMMSLTTNRLYTHEIIPSVLPVDKMPTRLGYVVRCSKTKATFNDGHTYIDVDGKYVKLKTPTDEGIKQIKDLYFLENTTTDMIGYGHVDFSLNTGDYVEPLI
jgi:hypothetical protein